MGSEKKKSVKKTLISLVYVLLLFVIIALVTLALYTEQHDGYIDFGGASFNTVILGETTLYALENGQADAFGTTLYSGKYYPGMTDEVFPFSVANGMTVLNVSEAAVSYTVRLRTLDSLPLNYALTQEVVDDTADDGYTTVTYTAGEAVEVADDTTGEIWYEYSFYVTTETDGKVTEASEEAAFNLDGGVLDLNEHSLLLSWDIIWADEDENDFVTVSTNDSVYMKEIENIQILVTTTSRNMVEEGYSATDNEALPTVGDLTSSGIIIIGPSDERVTYTYEIEHRAFSEFEPLAVPVAEGAEATDTLDASYFSWVIDNGEGKDDDTQTYGEDQTETSYSVALKVRYVADDMIETTIETTSEVPVEGDGDDEIKTETKTETKTVTTVTYESVASRMETLTDADATLTLADTETCTEVYTSTVEYLSANIVDVANGADITTADSILTLTDSTGSVMAKATDVTYQVINDKTGKVWYDGSADGYTNTLDAAIEAQKTFTEGDNEDYRIYAIYGFIFADQVTYQLRSTDPSGNVAFVSDAVSKTLTLSEATDDDLLAAYIDIWTYDIAGSEYVAVVKLTSELEALKSEYTATYSEWETATAERDALQKVWDELNAAAGTTTQDELDAAKAAVDEKQAEVDELQERLDELKTTVTDENGSTLTGEIPEKEAELVEAQDLLTNLTNKTYDVYAVYSFAQTTQSPTLENGAWVTTEIETVNENAAEGEEETTTTTETTWQAEEKQTTYLLAVPTSVVDGSSFAENINIILTAQTLVETEEETVEDPPVE